jgi:hypothetical protein
LLLDRKLQVYARAAQPLPQDEVWRMTILMEARDALRKFGGFFTAADAIIGGVMQPRQQSKTSKIACNWENTCSSA